jgi:competence protein ComEC
MWRSVLARLTALFVGVAGLGFSSQAQAAEAVLRVVDVGNSMCVVIQIPGGHHMLYDAGNFRGDECSTAVREIVGNDRLDLMVLSHSDADHIGEVATILQGRPASSGHPAVPAVPVSRIVYTGHAGTSRTTWPNALRALDGQPRGVVRDLSERQLPNTVEPRPGRTRARPLVMRLGAATVTFLAGWPEWWFYGDLDAPPNMSERRNAISIVVRVDFGAHSVLLTGDTIGRRGRSTEPVTACRDSEQWMVERHREGNISLDADILIGQHHGGDNSSSTCFINAVTPRFVIFPAGHAGHEHPRATTAQRLLSATPPIPAANIFRTDRGDDEGAPEWDEGRERGCTDPVGDDDVEIVLSDARGSQPVVRYRQPAQPCPSS